MTIAVVAIALQAVCAVGMLHTLHRLVWPNMARAGDVRLILDVWLPLAIAAPLLVMAARLPGSLSASAWMPLGGPVIVAFLALIVVLLLGVSGRVALTPWMAGAWSATGLVFLLLGAAHEMMPWIGQTMFALAAATMWINTPDRHEPRGDQASEERVVVGAMIVLPLGILQGLCALQASTEFGAASGALLLATSGIACAGAAASVGATGTIRIGGWAATYAMLFGLGIVSLLALFPALRGLLGQEALWTPSPVARGFGLFAPEATLLMVFPVVALVATRLPSRPRRWTGALLLALVAVLAAWRLDAGSGPVVDDPAKVQSRTGP